jgi:small subunit ribosomal protein S2
MAESQQNSLVQDLIEAGIHFGQRSSGWNPRMARFIYGKRNAIHIIDIKETIKGLLLAKKFLGNTVASGKDVCFVGTKRQAREVLQTRVGDIGMHWVTERWLGGTLTNFRTIRSRLKRLEELEQIEQADNFESYSKKMESQLRREMRKIRRNLEGIRNMSKLPGALVIIDVRREKNAIMEAKKLGIPTVCLIDTDGDPELADIPIPGNDDSMRSIDVVVRELCAAITQGKQMRVQTSGKEGEGEQERKRSSRAQFRSDEESPASDADEKSGGESAPAPAAAASEPAAG